MSLAENNRKKKIFISLDGGGTRGLISIQILSYIEKELGYEIGDLCDIIAGTSAGGIISCSKMNKIPNEKITELYKSIGKQVCDFKCSNVTESQSFANTKLYVDELSKLFQGNMNEFAKHRKGFVVSCLTPTLLPVDYKPFIISNYDNDHREYMEPKKMIDISVVDAIRATSGIPLLFNVPRYHGKNFLDGGYMNNNPTSILYKEALSIFGGENSDDFIFISIGTGKQDSSKFGAKMISTFKKPVVMFSDIANSVTGVELDSPVHRIVKFMTTTGEETHLTFRNEHPNLNYFRFDPLLDKEIAVNDASDETIEYMKKVTTDYCNSKEVIDFINQLKQLIQL